MLNELNIPTSVPEIKNWLSNDSNSENRFSLRTSSKCAVISSKSKMGETWCCSLINFAFDKIIEIIESFCSPVEQYFVSIAFSR